VNSRHFNVLLVEDDDDTRELLRVLLECDGFEVVPARDGLEGLDRLTQLRSADPDAPCVIVLDYMMPLIDGIEATRHIRRRLPSVEVLISDLNGRERDIRTVVESQPEILNHNVETVPRLQRPVRRRARWDRSVDVLAIGRRVAADIGYPMTTKTGLMLGLGETWDEVVEAMGLLHEAEVDVLTIGQYLRPSRNHLPLAKYYTPAEFMALRRIGLEMGFAHVQSGPLVRSSYHAAEQVPGSDLAAAG